MNPAHAKKKAHHPLLWWVMRGFWTFLTAVHMWPLAIVSHQCVTAPSVSSALGLLAVLGVTAVFALKAIDARMLRLHRPGLEFTAFVVITALIHGDAAAWRSSPALAAETATAVVVVAGGAGLGSRRFAQRFARLFRSLVSQVSLLRAGHAIGMVAVAAIARFDQACLRCTPARAPPLLVL